MYVLHVWKHSLGILTALGILNSCAGREKREGMGGRFLQDCWVWGHLQILLFLCKIHQDDTSHWFIPTTVDDHLCFQLFAVMNIPTVDIFLRLCLGIHTSVHFLQGVSSQRARDPFILLTIIKDFK